MLLYSCCTFSGSSWEGPVTDHFDGEVFYNYESGDRGLMDLIAWQLTKDKGHWDDYYPITQSNIELDRVNDSDLTVTFINHSTVLLQYDGINILTDPIWSENAGPVSYAGPSRRRLPGLKFEDLPPIDLVVISHNHYDHLDENTVIELKEVFDPVFLVPIGNKLFMESLGIEKVIQMDWWDKYNLNGREIFFVPARHFSNRGLCDRNTALWGGYVFITKGGPVYFAGDTGYGIHFRQIRDTFGPMRFSMLPIGAFKPRWFMEPVHIGPSEAVKAHKILESAKSIGIHFGTFSQADDSDYDPVIGLWKALNDYGVIPRDFVPLDNGSAIKVLPLLKK